MEKMITVPDVTFLDAFKRKGICEAVLCWSDGRETRVIYPQSQWHYPIIVYEGAVFVHRLASRLERLGMTAEVFDEAEVVNHVMPFADFKREWALIEQPKIAIKEPIP